MERRKILVEIYGEPDEVGAASRYLDRDEVAEVIGRLENVPYEVLLNYKGGETFKAGCGGKKGKDALKETVEGEWRGLEGIVVRKIYTQIER